MKNIVTYLELVSKFLFLKNQNCKVMIKVKMKKLTMDNEIYEKHISAA